MGAAADIANDEADELDDGIAAPGRKGAHAKGAHTRGGRARKAALERRCIVTRAAQSPDRMIRFVRAPDGTVVPDLKAVLPGRGAWVTATRDHVAEAVKRRAFVRAFKGEATVPADLPETVGRLLLERAVEGLSLANKAGAVIAGKGQVEDAARKGHILAILHAAEASAGESAKLDALALAVAKARGLEVTIVRDLGSDALGLALGRLHVIHAALSGSAQASPGGVSAEAEGASASRDTSSDVSAGAAQAERAAPDVSRMALMRIARLATYEGSDGPVAAQRRAAGHGRSLIARSDRDRAEVAAGGTDSPEARSPQERFPGPPFGEPDDEHDGTRTDRPRAGAGSGRLDERS